MATPEEVAAKFAEAKITPKTIEQPPQKKLYVSVTFARLTLFTPLIVELGRHRNRLRHTPLADHFEEQPASMLQGG